MNIAEILRRAFIGGGMPQTELVQRQVINFLAGHGETEAETLYLRIEMTGQPGHKRLAIDQAAQILVNKAQAAATQNGVAVDPINAGGRYRLILRPEDPAGK